MNYREFGKTGKKVSILGFGCMRLPEKTKVVDGIETLVIDDELAIPMVRKAIDAGVNYVDTAYFYHNGTSEAFVKRALADGYRQKVYIADKLPLHLIKNKDDVSKYFEEQFDRLGVDHIDFYLLHGINRDNWKTVLEFEILDFVEKKKAEGRIGHIGFSYHDSLEVFKKTIDSYDWEFAQIQLNYVDEEYQAGLEGFHYAVEKGMGIVIMEPLRGGNLVNKLPLEIEVEFKKVNNESPASWALKYLYDKKEVSVVLSGMSTMDNVEDNIRTASMNDLSLSLEEKSALEKAKRIFKEKIKVNCTQCKYCMPCPFGVAIPNVFTAYNDASLFDGKKEGKKRLEDLEKANKGAGNCVNCRACLKRCPQHLNIPVLLDEAVDYLK